MNGNSIISYYFDERKKANYMTWDKDPFVRGKVLQLKDKGFDKEANLHQQVEGYNIYIVFAGYTEYPGYEVPQYEIQQILNTMAVWYKKNVTPTFSKKNKSKLKSKQNYLQS